MKRILVALTFTAATAGAGVALAGDRTTTLKVRGMTCEFCPIIVQRAIATVPGVKEIVISTDNGTATVVYNDRATSPTEIAETVTNAGYSAWPKRR
jgi:Cu+-exporting ATPase